MPHKKLPFWIRAMEGPGTGGSAAPTGDAGAGAPTGGDGTVGSGEGVGQVPPAGQDTAGEAGVSEEGKTDVEQEGGEDPKARGSKEAVLADLARERDKRQALESELAEYRKAEEERKRAEMTDVEKAEADRKALEEKYTDAQAKIAAYEREKTLAAISEEFKIPAAMAGRIQGVTPEEMRADAKALAQSLGPYTGPSDPSAGRGGGTTPPASLDAAIAAAYTK